MKFKNLTLVASILLTTAMYVLAIVFDYSSEGLKLTHVKFYLPFILSTLIMVVVNYFIINFLLNYYSKLEMKKISTLLPESILDQENPDFNFKDLGEKVSEMNQKNVSEIDTMKEMETYRKEYIGNISHELKTPLFSIQGYVETLLDGGVENLSIRDKYLERIDKSVERLLNIVKDLDMINQYETGEIKLNVSTFDINQLVKECIDILDLEAQKKDAKVQLQSQHNQIFVSADKQKISQVLMNLLSNAIYYSNREKAQIFVKVFPLKTKIVIEVSDNGMGIKPEALPRIFERFYRVESSRSRREGGSGLGLAIVKHILEAHNTIIEVKSVYLEGTTFTFMLDRVNTSGGM